MEAQSRSQSPDYCRKGEVSGGEKQGGTLSDFTGLSGTDVCGTLVPTEKGGAIMKMTPDQDHERKGGLSQDGIELDLKVMREFIIEVTEQLEDKRLLKMLYIRAKTLKSL